MSDVGGEIGDGLPRVVVVGGGLAGLAAAVGLAGCGVRVELLEAKQSLGGRAGSYRDPESGDLLDHCQHVAMGCCTNFLDLCRRTGSFDLLERHRALHFFSAEGRRSDFAAANWLPAPLHLAPALLRMKHLGWRDQWCISWAMLRLVRMSAQAVAAAPQVAQWLVSQRQTPEAIERFWKVVLISALADSLDRISLAAARKVFVDGFLAHPQAADVYIPRVPLGELYDQRIATWLTARGVKIRLGTSVKLISQREPMGVSVQTAEGPIAANAVIVAVPWRQLPQLLDGTLSRSVPNLSSLENLPSSPISSVHLWTDREITDLPHAVLIDRLSQWVFARRDLPATTQGHYYQVVISASRELAGRPKEQVIDEVWRDLQAVFPLARGAKLQSARLITQREAVFSSPADDPPRLSQQTLNPALVLAGDWTNTGWPATMEGAVRSGYLAAEQVLSRPEQGTPQFRQNAPHPPEPREYACSGLLQPDLHRGWLARMLIRP